MKPFKEFLYQFASWMPVIALAALCFAMVVAMWAKFHDILI